MSGKVLRVILFPLLPLILFVDWLVDKLPGGNPGDYAPETSEHCEDGGCEVCGCGNQPPYHCMYCCQDFNDDQLRAFQLPPYNVKEPANQGEI